MDAKEIIPLCTQICVLNILKKFKLRNKIPIPQIVLDEYISSTPLIGYFNTPGVSEIRQPNLLRLVQKPCDISHSSDYCIEPYDMYLTSRTSVRGWNLSWQMIYQSIPARHSATNGRLIEG